MNLSFFLAVKAGVRNFKHMTTLTQFASSLCFTAAVFSSTLPAQEVEPGFKSLFNGKDLTGWAGRANHWSVQDGAITGSTSKENPAQGNNFLIAQSGETNMIVDNFELRLSYKFSGDWGNSGVQYRSKDRGKFVV